jgi:transglutaminase-like putative cysteine protease
VDASRVNVNYQGTYYAIYTAWDKAGNSASFWRRVVVAHDSSDTDALVKSIAAELPADAEIIRDYVRNNIVYSYSYGGGDPVWFGFTEWHGNCYVHAKTFQALLTEKGFTSRLIWVTDETHYWLQVFLNGKWVHMDATPSTKHGKYSIMNDEQRYETLSGRDWDRTQWPACE